MKVKIVAHEASVRNGYEIKIGSKVTYSYVKPVEGNFVNMFGSQYLSAKIDYVKAVKIVKVKPFSTDSAEIAYHFPIASEMEIAEEDEHQRGVWVDKYLIERYSRTYWIEAMFND